MLAIARTLTPGTEYPNSSVRRQAVPIAPTPSSTRLLGLLCSILLDSLTSASLLVGARNRLLRAASRHLGKPSFNRASHNGVSHPMLEGQSVYSSIVPCRVVLEGRGFRPRSL